MPTKTAFVALIVALIIQVASAQDNSPAFQDSGGCPVGECSALEFCSSDGTCRERSCENYFQFGNGAFDLDNTDGIELVCENYSTGTQDNLHAVVYGCQGYGPGVELPRGVVSQVFNRRCTATVKNKGFECYNLKPGTDFSSFLNRVNRTILATCSGETANGAPGIPFFKYNVYTRSPGFIVIHPSPPRTSTFSEASAFQSSYAIVTDLPTDAPTQSPTEAPTTETIPPTQSGSSYALHGGIAPVVALTILGILIV